MSIIIKGTTKAQFYKDTNKITYMDVGWDIEELPPHGRLIDATKLCELCDIMSDKCGDSSVWNQFKNVVEDLPTIIEEDKE